MKRGIAHRGGQIKRRYIVPPERQKVTLTMTLYQTSQVIETIAWIARNGYKFKLDRKTCSEMSRTASLMENKAVEQAKALEPIAVERFEECHATICVYLNLWLGRWCKHIFHKSFRD